MYKAVSVIELLCGDIQSWLKEETTLVMKGEKKKLIYGIKRKNLHCNVF